MKRILQATAGIALGLLLVWLLFRNTEWSEVAEAIRGADVRWLLLGQIPLWLTFPMRVQRWTYIVRAGHEASYRHLFSATQIGFLANFTLPARVGEVIRAVVLTRLTGVPFSKAFAMGALDRVTDLFGLMVVMGVALAAYQPVDDVIIPAETFGLENPIVFSAAQYRLGALGAALFLVAVVSVFVLLYTSRAWMLRVSDRIVGLVSDRLKTRVHTLLDQFADGLTIFRSPIDMAKSLAFSLATWLLATLSLVCFLQAFGFDWPWYTPFVAHAMLAVFVSAPGAPGFVGQFHVPLVISLAMLIPLADVDHMKAFAIVVHLIQLPPVALLGIYCLSTERLGILELQRAGHRMTADEE